MLGRNCRFIQGPATDNAEVAKLRAAIVEGSDVSVCLLNYRIDGTTFWNQVTTGTPLEVAQAYRRAAAQAAVQRPALSNAPFLSRRRRCIARLCATSTAKL